MNRSLPSAAASTLAIALACITCVTLTGCAHHHAQHVDKAPAPTATPASTSAPGTASAAAPDIHLPPGWTEADMQACMIAGTPGDMHKRLAEGAGVWDGKITMWMYPGGEPATSDVVCTAGPIMGGRFLFTELQGEMPGMGPYHGSGVAGYDNVIGKFVTSWIDNQGTGILNGTGELSPDGKVLTWRYTFHCPINKKPAVLRQIETITGPNTKTLVMFGPDPKTGKEFKMMSIVLTRRPAEAKQEK